MEKKYKLGYTSGVFDMFHIGHLNIIMRAKEQCESLIVAVSTDELVRGYKNKTPVIPFEERAAIVGSIRYVDRVVPQVDRDKAGAWKAYGFDAMFVGDDWKGDPLFEETEREFKEYGVDIVYFPYTQGVSSTELQKKLELLNEIKLMSERKFE